MGPSPARPIAQRAPAEDRRFALGLAAVAGVAVLVRLVHLLFFAPPSRGAEDAFFFRVVADGLAEGRGFEVLSPDLRFEPTAAHPPLYPLVLSVLLRIGVEGDETLRALGLVTGTATVCALGLIGRRFGGAAVGLLAAGLAAVHPLLVAADGALLSESLYGAVIGFCLLAAHRLWEQPSARRAAVLGAGVAVAALVRAEALLFVPLLALPLAWRGRAGQWRRVGAVLVSCALVLAPWVVRNALVFDGPVFSNNAGLVIGETNCAPAYAGRDLGWLAPNCQGPRGTKPEAVRSAELRERGLRYASEHASRLPVVVGVRVLRAWGFYEPLRGADEQGRSANVQRAGIAFYFALLLPALIGALALSRSRHAPLLVLLAPVAVVTVTTAATFGSLRFRHPAELSLVVLAAVGAAHLVARRQRVRRYPTAFPSGGS